MKKLIWLTTIFVLILVFGVPVILSVSLKMIPGNIQPGYDPNVRLAIYQIRDFKQKFVARVDNITAIGISIRNPNLKNKSDVILNLYDKEGILLRTSKLNGANIEDGSLVKFVFPVVTGTKSKEFSFTLSSPGAGAEETIELFIIDKKDLASGITDYVYMGEIKQGGTPIVVFTKPESKFKVIKDVFSNLFSRLLSIHS